MLNALLVSYFHNFRTKYRYLVWHRGRGDDDLCVELLAHPLLEHLHVEHAEEAWRQLYKNRSSRKIDSQRLFSRLVTDYILATDFSSKNDRLTGYNQLSQKCSRQDKLTPGN